MIYEYVFANESVHVQPKSSNQDLRLLRLQGRQKHQTVISLLTTCHLIRKEPAPSSTTSSRMIWLLTTSAWWLYTS
jgi:hypothetical protein